MRTVAVIDDDAVFADQLAGALHPLGVRMIHFPEAKRFFEAAPFEAVDLTLIDLDMPDSGGMRWEYGGIEVLKTLRNKVGDSPEVCMLTGNDNPFLVNASADNGADGYFEKQADFSALATEIRDYLVNGPGV